MTLEEAKEIVLAYDPKAYAEGTTFFFIYPYPNARYELAAERGEAKAWIAAAQSIVTASDW